MTTGRTGQPASAAAASSHLEENMAAADIGLDSEARDLLG
jgi:hypothetical protein